jgi:NAD(P)-dependent dehydrogenase (short-subunit alcohol dehydrogenase family)
MTTRPRGCRGGRAARGYGRIVNVTSVHARFSAQEAIAYDTSKAGLEGATRTLGIELASRGACRSGRSGAAGPPTRWPAASSGWRVRPTPTVTIDGGLTATF